MCKSDIDLVLDVHPVEKPARAYRNTSRAPRGQCLDPHVQVFRLDEHLGQGRYPIHPIYMVIGALSNVYLGYISEPVAVVGGIES